MRYTIKLILILFGGVSAFSATSLRADNLTAPPAVAESEVATSIRDQGRNAMATMIRDLTRDVRTNAAALESLQLALEANPDSDKRFAGPARAPQASRPGTASRVEGRLDGILRIPGFRIPIPRLGL